MLKKILLTFFLLHFIYSFSQKNDSNIQQSNKIEMLNKKVDSLIARQNETKTKILEERITQATETITNQSSVISSFGNIYVVITLIITLIGISLPFITYLFGIKPSRDALKEFEKNSMVKFNEFLKENTNKQIQNAVENLHSEDNQVKNNALGFLSVNFHHGFTKKQVALILEIINKNTDVSFSDQLLNFISNRKNEDLKKYYIDYLNTNKKVDSKIYYCIRFFSLYKYSEYKNELKTYINNNGNLMFTVICTYMSGLSKNTFINFLNDQNIIDSLSEDSLKYISSDDFAKSNILHWNLSEEEFKLTNLHEKLKNMFTPVN